MKTKTRLWKRIRKGLLKADPKANVDTPAPFILLASASVGPNIVRISKALGVSRAAVRPIAKRLRGQGVWRGGKVCCDWFDKKTGGIAFWCDVLVAEGLMNRPAPSPRAEEKGGGR